MSVIENIFMYIEIPELKEKLKEKKEYVKNLTKLVDRLKIHRVELDRYGRVKSITSKKVKELISDKRFVIEYDLESMKLEDEKTFHSHQKFSLNKIVKMLEKEIFENIKILYNIL